MTEPTGAQTNATGGRTYVDPQTGKRVPSVTTVNRMIAKPALVDWAAKMAATRAVENYDELTHRMTHGTRSDALQWLGSAHRDHTTRAAVRGSEVHDIAEAMVKGEHVDERRLTVEIQPYVDGYLRFIEDHNPQFKFTETTFINHEKQYAGTADFGAVLWSTFDTIIVGDWKTGNTGPYLEWAYQLAAYVRAPETLHRTLKDNGEVEYYTKPAPFVHPNSAAVVRILPGRYELWWIGEGTALSMEYLYRGFLAANTLYRLDKAAGKHGADAFRRG